MRSLAEHMSISQHYHTHRNIILTHAIGIPLMIFALMIPIGWVKLLIPGVLEMISLNWLVVITLFAYYLCLDIVLALTTIIGVAIITLLANFFTSDGPTRLSLGLFIGCFIVGWLMQVIGRLMADKRFILIDKQILVSPLFLMAKLFFRAGYKKKLQEKIHSLARNNGKNNS
ncbi:MAG: DUF962 domain-containing protein [Gammaproteobacteria bacterium]|nr:DUF962 domain-containing protein [Gammaproteobacteria bacterium]